MLRSLAILCLAISAGGCVPAVHVDVPAFHGRLVDADGLPIAGAVISLEQVSGLPYRPVQTVTGPDGTFHQREQGFLYLASPVPMELRWFKNWNLVIADGDRRLIIREKMFSGTRVFWVESGSTRERDFGTLRLPPKS